MTLAIEDVEPLYPSIPRSNEPHPIHQRIAEVVGALDELRTRVNILRLKFGESDNTRERLDHAIDWLNGAENFIAEARTSVMRQGK